MAAGKEQTPQAKISLFQGPSCKIPMIDSAQFSLMWFKVDITHISDISQPCPEHGDAGT